jgi:hypothetical protein
MTLLAVSAMLVLAACGRNNDENNDNNTTPPANNTATNNTTANNTTANNTTANNTTANNTTANNTTANNTTANNTTPNNTSPGVLAVAPDADGAVDVGATQSYTVTGADPEQAYRITLVVADNITVTDGAGTFVDNDDNGAADAGASENIALITSVNGTDQTGAKTVPAGDDDPAAPSGVFPTDAGEITFVVTGQAAGKVYPVIYHNAGASTFLEIDANGAPTETHIVGGGLTVNGEMSTDPDPTCENYCTTVMANCTGDNAQYSSEAECLDYCNNVGNWQDGTKGDTDGDTIACRIYHGNAPATMDAALHCPHAGPSGGGVCGSYCDVYCNLSFEHCVGPNKHYDTPAECATACGGFADTGNPGDTQYDTVQCRVYHLGAPAAADPDTHCPHGGETPTAFCVGAPEDFVFRTDAPGDYTRVDRKGMPGVATALISSKDAYNAASPADDVDANNPFVAEIITALNGIHMALDDDLAGLTLTPCTVVGDGTGTCVAQGAPLILPDTLKIDTGADARFPNGRRLADPVMDITLAVVLIDLGTHAVTTFADLPLNPPANDLGVEGAFLSSFPYLHPPHTP